MLPDIGRERLALLRGELLAVVDARKIGIERQDDRRRYDGPRQRPAPHFVHARNEGIALRPERAFHVEFIHCFSAP